MNTDQQIKQLKEAIRSSELMIIEQSKIIVNLNIELDDTKNKLTTTVSDCQNKINDLKQNYALLEAEKDKEINKLLIKMKEFDASTVELQLKNAQLEKDFQKIIIDLERQLIDTKLQFAQQSSDYEEAKRDVMVLKKQMQEQLSSESDKTSNSPNHSLIINEGQDFSTSQFILNDKSMLRDIDISFKNSAIQKNKEFLKNLNAPPALTKHDSIDFFSPEQCNLRVLINPEYDSFPVIERNGSMEIDFIPSPQKISSSTQDVQNFQSITLTPQKTTSIEKQQEYIIGISKINRILVTQHQPQIIILNEKEKVQVSKVLEENSTNASLQKTYANEIIPILDTLCLYSSIKSELIQQKMANLLRKQPAPQNLRKRIWPHLIGNKLRINKKLYKNLEHQMQVNPICSKISSLIREDMHRTYPNFSLFDKGSQTNETLQTILEQFNYFRPDVGYVQGMAYPAAILFLYLGDSYLTFKYFNNLIAGNEFISNLYKFKIDKIKIYLKTFDFFLSQKHPNCTKHLEKLHIQSDIFLIEWFYTLYCRAFSFSVVAKIWDLMLTQGEVLFYKVGISIFGCIEKDLIDKDFDDTLFLIRNCTNKIDPDMLIKQIYSQKLTTEKVFQKYQKLMEEMQFAEKIQLKKSQEAAISLNSSSSSTSTQSSTTVNGASGLSGLKTSGIKSEGANLLLKPPSLETIDEMNSSTHSAALITHNTSEEKQIDDCITLHVNHDQTESDLNKENINQLNSNNKPAISLQKMDSGSFCNINQSNAETQKEGLINQNPIQEIIQN